MNSSNKIISNTLVIYTRVAITSIVALLSSRWILQSLGITDFGIYNLVAGLLAMLMVLNSSMAAATQRFLSYSIGEGNQNIVKKTFNLSLFLHFFIGIFTFILIETVGSIFLLQVLSIPSGREEAALFCLHCLSVSTCFSIVSVPFTAMLFSYENMIFMSIVQIGEAILKLIAAIFLLHYIGDRLKLYALCITILSLFSIILLAVYCRFKYECCRLSFEGLKDKSYFKSYSTFAFWSLIGSVSTMLKNQGAAMLLNVFYGVTINAAYGIASQIKGQLMFVSSSILTAARPQIVQSEGNGNRFRVLSLSSSASKFSFLLLSYISIPFIVEMPVILRLWLGVIPQYTVEFSILIIITNLIFQFYVGVSLPFESIGKIKKIQLITGLLNFLVLPIGYVFLKFGCPPMFLLISVLIEELVCIFIMIYISRELTGMSAKRFIVKTMILPIIAVIGTLVITYFVHFIISSLWSRLLLVVLVSCIVLSVLSYSIALEDFEKRKLNEIVVKICKMIKRLFPRLLPIL